MEQFGGHIYLSWWLYIFSMVTIYAQYGGNIDSYYNSYMSVGMNVNVLFMIKFALSIG